MSVKAAHPSSGHRWPPARMRESSDEEEEEEEEGEEDYDDRDNKRIELSTLQDARIRVGKDYQAKNPTYLNPEERPEEYEERDLMIWTPNDDISDEELNDFISTAKEKFGYNMEQAMTMLFYHNFNIAETYEDFPNYVPMSEDEWTPQEKILFDTAFEFHGKHFRRLRHLLPGKSISSLVKYYYLWKKTRLKPSTVDKSMQKLQARMAAGESNKNANDISALLGQELVPPEVAPSKPRCKDCSRVMKVPHPSPLGPLCSSCYRHWWVTGNHRLIDRSMEEEESFSEDEMMDTQAADSKELKKEESAEAGGEEGNEKEEEEKDEGAKAEDVTEEQAEMSKEKKEGEVEEEVRDDKMDVGGLEEAGETDEVKKDDEVEEKEADKVDEMNKDQNEVEVGNLDKEIEEKLVDEEEGKKESEEKEEGKKEAEKKEDEEGGKKEDKVEEMKDEEREEEGEKKDDVMESGESKEGKPDENKDKIENEIGKEEEKMETGDENEKKRDESDEKKESEEGEKSDKDEEMEVGDAKGEDQDKPEGDKEKESSEEVKKEKPHVGRPKRERRVTEEKKYGKKVKVMGKRKIMEPEIDPRLKIRRPPPPGLSLNYDDLRTVKKQTTEETVLMLKSLDDQVKDLKRESQKNKQWFAEHVTKQIVDEEFMHELENLDVNGEEASGVKSAGQNSNNGENSGETSGDDGEETPPSTVSAAAVVAADKDDKEVSSSGVGASVENGGNSNNGGGGALTRQANGELERNGGSGGAEAAFLAVAAVTSHRSRSKLKWAKEEVQIVIEGLRHFGVNTASIADLLETRNERDLLNFFNSAHVYGHDSDLLEALNEFEANHGIIPETDKVKSLIMGKWSLPAPIPRTPVKGSPRP